MSNAEVVIESQKSGAVLRVTWRGLIASLLTAHVAVVGLLSLAADYRYAPKKATEDRLLEIENEQRHSEEKFTLLRNDIRDMTGKFDELNRYLRNKP